MSRQMQQIPDLAFQLNPDGSIDIEQGYTDVAYITLHSCHVRHLFELAGHLLPPPPADELSKNLAVQLCMIFDGLKEEIGRSPGIDQLFFQAATVVELLPNSVYPHWLYADENDQPPDSEKSGTTEQTQHTEFQLQPSPKEPV